MKKILKKVILYILFSVYVLGANNEGKGTLNIQTEIIPVGKTKKYGVNKKLILDAGILNSETSNNKIVLASIKVRMYTSQNSTDEGGNANGISGDFNLGFDLKRFDEHGRREEISLGPLVQYKNGNNVKMKLFAENFRIMSVDVRDPNDSNRYYFIAYPNEAQIGNEIVSMIYTFDLCLEVEGVRSGDIVRQDVTTSINSGEGNAEATGWLKDIIKDQFRKLQL